jgi:SAM-dependent methyltransferase
MTELYTAEFYDDLREGTARSAALIAPMVLDLVHPRSVVDVGCGSGGWLAAFQRLGIEDVLGLDSEQARSSGLAIPPERFRTADLERAVSVERRFDLVVSLEVGEHLPAEAAETFVDSLTRLGPVILFSAAIPFQGGTGHVNEQWPEYWLRLFAARGFTAIDCLRERIWDHAEIEWWYAQNAVLYVEAGALERYPELSSIQQRRGTPSSLSRVHPRHYLKTHDELARESAGWHHNAEAWHAEAERLEAEAKRWYAEAERLRAALNDAKDPRNLRLEDLLLAIPGASVSAVRRTVRRGDRRW